MLPPFSDKVSSEMMSLMTDEELATMLSRLEQQELDCQTGSGAVPGKLVCHDIKNDNINVY